MFSGAAFRHQAIPAFSLLVRIVLTNTYDQMATCGGEFREVTCLHVAVKGIHSHAEGRGRSRSWPELDAVSAFPMTEARMTETLLAPI